MSRKKKDKPRSHLAVTPKTSENKGLDHLPLQKPEEVCLYATDTEELRAVENASLYREGLVKFKVKFLWEIQEWSKRFGIEAETRVYFELKPGG